MRQQLHTPKRSYRHFLGAAADGERRSKKKRYIICEVMGNFNAKAGDVEDRESGDGKFGLGTQNGMVRDRQVFAKSTN